MGARRKGVKAWAWTVMDPLVLVAVVVIVEAATIVLIVK